MTFEMQLTNLIEDDRMQQGTADTGGGGISNDESSLLCVHCSESESALALGPENGTELRRATAAPFPHRTSDTKSAGAKRSKFSRRTE